LPLPEVSHSFLETLLKSAVLAGGPDGWLEREAAREYDQIRVAAFEDPFKVYFDLSAGVLKPSSNEIFQNAVAEVAQIARERYAAVTRQIGEAGFQLPEGSPHLSEGGIVGEAPGSPAGLAAGSVAVLYGERL